MLLTDLTQNQATQPQEELPQGKLERSSETMKTRVIPAQITTVEDKIAGNLNFTQVLLLIASILINTGIFVIFPPAMKFSLYKVPFIAFVFILFGILAIRVKGRVILNWITLLASYWLRPHIYIYDKNDPYLRDIEFPVSPKKTQPVKTLSINKKQDLRKENGKIDYARVLRSRDLNIKFQKSGILATKNQL